MSRISLALLLDAVAGFDELGGASVGLAAWELCVDEGEVAGTWAEAIADGLLKRSGHDDVHGEELWRLSAGGWAALGDRGGGGPDPWPFGAPRSHPSRSGPGGSVVDRDHR